MVRDGPVYRLDGASQIASLGLGFSPGRFRAALDNGDLGELLVANPDTEAIGADRGALDDYSRFLLKHSWPGMRYTSFTSSGAEANEKALDMCRLHGPGGRRVLAFEGSFHGRTLLALHATHNPDKRKPFELKGYQAVFVPFGGDASSVNALRRRGRRSLKYGHPGETGAVDLTLMGKERSRRPAAAG